MEKNNGNIDFEEIIKDIIYDAEDIKDLKEIEQDIKDCDYNLQALVYDKFMFRSARYAKRYIMKDTNLARTAPCKSEEYEDFEKRLKNDDELKKRISDAINNCRNYLYEFQDFYQCVEKCISSEYNYIRYDEKNRVTNTLLKLERGILEIDEDVSFRDNEVKQFINLLKDYINKTKCFYYYYNDRDKRKYYNIAKELQKMCLKYGHRCDDLKQFYEQLRSKIIQQRSFVLSYLSKQYHKKYFKKACICFIGAFIWFIITSLLTHINLPAGILGWININFKPTLEVNDELLKYIVWITIKTPSIILAWIGLSYLRAADRHDQDAKELSNLYQYKSMITDPVTQDALMVALAPNYFGTKRNRRSDNNFMEKLLLKMIPTLNINAGGGNNNGNNGGQNGGKTD